MRLRPIWVVGSSWGAKDGVSEADCCDSLLLGARVRVQKDQDSFSTLFLQRGAATVG